MIFPKLAIVEEDCARSREGLKPFACAMLSNIIVDLLESYSTYALRRDGIDLRIIKGDYDNILQEAMGGASNAVGAGVDAVLVVMWLPAFSSALGFEYAQASADTIEREVNRIKEYCAATISNLRAHITAPILWTSFEPPAWPAYGIADPGLPAGHVKVIAELNSFVADELQAAGNAFLIDLGLCQQRVGARHFYDWRYWHLAKAPFTRDALGELALQTARYVRALSGRTRKCLILDCDNTLWDGIVGEDGPAGIKLGDASQGSAYRDFQREVLNLYHRGVVLAICSKNNLADVMEVLHGHQGMLLREEHFAAMRVNWQDKAANIREIAAELGLGMDSIVFIDDSEFEASLVRSLVPEVEVLLASTKNPAQNWRMLAECGLFDGLNLSEEDRSRGQMYRAEAERRKFRAGAVDLKEYLRSLEMRLKIQAPREDDLERAAQLCQRTNQFNLTTLRYTRDELAARQKTGEYLLRSLVLSDRFGDYGTVGFAVIRTGETATIEVFLLSCRVLGRGVETAFLSACVDAAREIGAVDVMGQYVPSKKNGQVATFYADHGFSLVPSEGTAKWFRLDLAHSRLEAPTHFSSIEATRAL